ncbi:MAG: hypothetical protein LBU81_00250 [Methanosarcinales archaeon]|jgi:hypothetical protein|nr:hypothetical protein [Methanosarcinales archaeon]
MAAGDDPILAAFSFLFLIWFILLIVAEIYYCARNRTEKSKKMLYAGFIVSFIAAFFLTIYIAYFSQDILGIGFILSSFIGNFLLWVSPAVIAVLIYGIYAWKNKQTPKRNGSKKREEPPKNLSSSIYGNALQKNSEKKE